MKAFIFTCILFASTTFNAQTIDLPLKNIDETLLNKTSWVQADDSPNGLETPINAEKDAQYKSNKLAFYKTKKWGSLLDNKNEFVVGNWEVKDNQIILYDLYAKGKGFNCEIVKLTKDVLMITYIDLHKKFRTIQLIPA
jgi:hypothetical protein